MALECEARQVVDLGTGPLPPSGRRCTCGERCRGRCYEGFLRTAQSFKSSSQMWLA